MHYKSAKKAINLALKSLKIDFNILIINQLQVYEETLINKKIVKFHSHHCSNANFLFVKVSNNHSSIEAEKSAKT